MKERLINMKNQVLELSKQIEELEQEMKPIKDQLKVNKELISQKQVRLYELEKNKEKLQENKLVRFMLSPIFYIIPIGIIIILITLSLLFSTIILFLVAVAFCFSYIGANAITINLLKKDLPEIILEKMKPEYSICISEITKLKQEIIFLNNENRKLEENKAPFEQTIRGKRKKRQELSSEIKTELFVEKHITGTDTDIITPDDSCKPKR